MLLKNITFALACENNLVGNGLGYARYRSANISINQRGRGEKRQRRSSKVYNTYLNVV